MELNDINIILQLPLFLNNLNSYDIIVAAHLQYKLFILIKVTYLTPSAKEEAYLKGTTILANSGCESPVIRLLEDWKMSCTPFLYLSIHILSYIYLNKKNQRHSVCSSY